MKRGPADRRIFINNLTYECKWQDLKDLFRKEVGEVNYVELFNVSQKSGIYFIMNLLIAIGILLFVYYVCTKDKVCAVRCAFSLNFLEFKQTKKL